MSDSFFLFVVSDRLTSSTIALEVGLDCVEIMYDTRVKSGDIKSGKCWGAWKLLSSEAFVADIPYPDPGGQFFSAWNGVLLEEETIDKMRRHAITKVSKKVGGALAVHGMGTVISGEALTGHPDKMTGAATQVLCFYHFGDIDVDMINKSCLTQVQRAGVGEAYFSDLIAYHMSKASGWQKSITGWMTAAARLADEIFGDELRTATKEDRMEFWHLCLSQDPFFVPTKIENGLEKKGTRDPSFG